MNFNLKKDFNLFATSNGVRKSALTDYQKSINNYVSPTIIEERQMNVATLDVFSRLMYDRIIFMGTAIDDDVANIIMSQLLYLDSNLNGNKSDISIYINSPGGSVYAGNGILDVMDFIKSDITTICTGIAASMAAVILSNGTKGKRHALPRSRVMIHQVSSASSGSYSDMEIGLKEMKRTRDELYQTLAKNTGKSFDEMVKLCDRDNWFSADEACNELHIIDTVLR